MLKRKWFSVICFYIVLISLVFTLPSATVNAADSQGQNMEAEDNEDEPRRYISVGMNLDGSKTEEWVTLGKNGVKYIQVIDYDKDGNQTRWLTGSERTDEEGTEIRHFEGTDIDNNEIYKTEKVYSSWIREYENYIVEANGNQTVTIDVRYVDGSTYHEEEKLIYGGGDFLTIHTKDKDKKETEWKYEYIKQDIEYETEYGYDFEIKTLGVNVLGMQPKTKTLIVEDDLTTYKGHTYNIIGIDDKAFSNNKKVKTVKIGQNVEKIGAGAFKNDKKLKKVVIFSDKISSVGKAAFEGIANGAVIHIRAGKTRYKEIVALIKESGIDSSVKFKRSELLGYK